MKCQAKAIYKLALPAITLIPAAFIILGATTPSKDEIDKDRKSQHNVEAVDQPTVIPYKKLHPENKFYKKIDKSNARLNQKGPLPESLLETRVVDTQSSYSPPSEQGPKSDKSYKNFFCSRNPNRFSYSLWKKKIQKCTNIEYSLDISLLPQYGTNGNSKLSWQTMYCPYINCELFNNSEQGAGSIQFGYTLVRYWGNSALTLGNAMGLAGGINDFTSNASNFNQLTYTQVFPGSKCSLIVGQYSLYAIDGTAYDNDQQTGFISYALSQNASATYSLGSLGAYGQVNLCSNLIVQAGFQDAFNINGTNIDFFNLSKNKYNTFLYTQWNPTNKCGTGQYSLLIYNTRLVPQQAAKTTGWSFNFSQNINKKISYFGRANGASGNAIPIKRSFVLGVAGADICNRNPNDLIGLAMAVNAVSTVGAGVTDPNLNPIRSQETVLEAFCTIGCGPYISFSPDFQFYIHPARNPQKNTVVAYGLRTNITL